MEDVLHVVQVFEHIQQLLHLRGVFPGELSEREARDLIDAEPSMSGRDLAGEVSPEEPIVLDADAAGPKVVALDTGIKRSIVSNLRQRGCHLVLMPSTSTKRSLA